MLEVRRTGGHERVKAQGNFLGGPRLALHTTVEDLEVNVDFPYQRRAFLSRELPRVLAPTALPARELTTSR